MARKKERTIDVPQNPSRVKGKLAEAIVAAMHEAPGLAVRTNVAVRPLMGGRPREIDVLIDGSFANYPFRLAIECKNERQRAGAPEIDAFIGKLIYLGIPPQQGIFVSVTGFTKGASERARVAGLRTLVLLGLTQDRLRAALFGAVQNVVHLLPIVTEWSIISDIAKATTSWHMGWFFDEFGELAGTLPDLAWRAWHEGELPSAIGEHHLRLRLPNGWRHIIDGKESIPSELSAKIHIHGLTVSISGTAERFDLVNPETGLAERTHVRAAFNSDAKVLHLGTFESETALAAALTSQSASVRITARLRLPRIQIGGVLWPPSEQAWRKLTDLTAPDETGRRPGPGSIDLSTLESNSFATLFEPVWVSDPLRKVLRAQYAPESAG